tara:strand:+ start:157 stop:408 length:252 start_codon:yes stop_codon:yes gene_type:complete
LKLDKYYYLNPQLTVYLLVGRFKRSILKPNMTDKSIESELKDVHKKLDDIEKKQEMMNKLYQLDQDKKKKMGELPSTHIREMM